MRVFMLACLAAAVIAVGASVLFDRFLEEPASAAFTESSARIN